MELHLRDRTPVWRNESFVASMMDSVDAFKKRALLLSSQVVFAV